MSVPRLLALLAKTFRCDPALLNDQADMLNVPGWDSLSHMTMVMVLESAYGIELSGDEIAELQSLAAIRAALLAHGVDA